MNIFVPYPDETRNAQMLDDLRLSKMVVESAQMLSAALHRHGHPGTDIYKESYPKHPCTLWAGETRSNFMYLVKLGRAIEKERMFRDMNPSKSFKIVEICGSFKSLIPRGNLTPFVNCTSDFKNIPDVHEAYQKQMAVKWFNDIRKPRWLYRHAPEIYQGWRND